MRIWRLPVFVVVSIAVIILMAGVCPGQEDQLLPVSGKVLMPDGSPASGAFVEARSIPQGSDWQVDATAASNDDGSFTLQLKPGGYLIYAVRGDLVYLNPYEMIYVSQDGSLSKPIEMRLEKGCKVEGSVVDVSNSQPVGGVLIITRNGDSAVSSESGHWSMMLAKGRYTITAIKEGCWWPIVNFNASEDTVNVKVETKPGAVLKGRIIDEDGQPIADAHISQETAYFNRQSARTDTEGRFELKGLNPDSMCQYRVGADGYEYLFDQYVTFTPGQREAEVELTLIKIRLRKINGRVTWEDGSPVEGATVAYGYSTNYVGYTTATTDEDGRYSLEADVWNNLVVVSGRGLAPVCKSVEADKDVEIDFQVKPGHIVEGRVEDEDGNPMAGVHISVSMEVDDSVTRSNLYSTIAYASTDEDGRFRLENLPEGFVFADFFLADYDYLDNERLKVDRTDYTLVLREKVEGQICGIAVSDTDGKPLDEFNVQLDFSYKGVTSGGLSPGLLEHGVSFQNTDGEFRVKGLKVGEGYRVNITAPGYRQASVDPVIVTPVSEENCEDLIVRLKPASPFEGRITEAGAGDPIEGVLVTVWDMGSRVSGGSLNWDMSGTSLKSVSTHTGTDGTFRFEAMPYSYGTIMLEKKGLARNIIKQIGLSKPLQVCMEKGAVITGSIADEQGNVDRTARINLTHLDTFIDFDQPQISSDGSFEVTDLPPGEYIVRLRRGGSTEKHHFFELEPGGTYHVDWAVHGVVKVEGVVLQNGKPVPGANIIVNTSKGGMNWAGSAETDDNGCYTLSLFKPGTYLFSCDVGEWADPYRLHQGKTLQLTEGPNKVDFDLPYGSISGKLISKLTGKPLADTSVKLYVRETDENRFGRSNLHFSEAEPIWQPESGCKTDRNGKFQAGSLKAGEWLICLLHEGENGYILPAVIVNLADGEAKTGVIAEVPPTGSAAINIDGEDTLPEGAYVVCIDDYGLTHYPKLINNKLSLDFNNLPVGKMTASVVGNDYYSTSVPFEVQRNETAEVTVNLSGGSGIEFRLKEDSPDPLKIAFKLTTLDGKPVLRRAEVPYWGSVINLAREIDRPTRIAVEPGTYIITTAIVNEEDIRNSWDGFTGCSNTVKVSSGEFTVIELPLNGNSQEQ